MNVILITPHGRAGSYFLQSLLDGGDEVVSFPHAFAYDFPAEVMDVRAEVRRFADCNPGCFDSSKGYLGTVGHNVTGLLGENRDEHVQIDLGRFTDIALRYEFEPLLMRSKVIQRRDFVIGLHKALARLLGKNVQALKYILIHLHNYSGGHNCALNDFPDLHYFAMTRDPREDWVSWQRVLELRYGSGFFAAKQAYLNSTMLSYATFVVKLYEFSIRMKRDNLTIIDLCILHARGVDGMRCLAQRLGINYIDSFSKTTFLGKVWWGNSADRQPICGFRTTPMESRWMTALSKEEEAVISSSLKESIRVLGYPPGTVDEKFAVKRYRRASFRHFTNLFLRNARAIVNRQHYDERDNPLLRKLPLAGAKLIHMLVALRIFSHYFRQLELLGIPGPDRQLYGCSFSTDAFFR